MVPSIDTQPGDIFHGWVSRRVKNGGFANFCKDSMLHLAGSSKHIRNNSICTFLSVFWVFSQHFQLENIEKSQIWIVLWKDIELKINEHLSSKSSTTLKDVKANVNPGRNYETQKEKSWQKWPKKGEKENNVTNGPKKSPGHANAMFSSGFIWTVQVIDTKWCWCRM